MLEGHDIVCISVMDWEHPFQSSRHHLMRELAQRNRVLFVDNQLNPLSVLRQAHEPAMRRKLRSWLGQDANPQLVEPNMWVYAPPPVLPMGRLTNRALFGPAYALNQAALRAGVRAACRALAFERPILWISFNVLSSESAIGALDESLVVYHCTDEITAMPNTSVFAGEIERRLLAKADVVFTSSRQLLADKSPFNANCHFVPNGADTALFEAANAPDTPVHPAIDGLGRPRIAFTGHIEARFDFALVTALAERRPDWTIAIAGPIAEDQRAAADALARLPNVHFAGLLKRAELPGFLKGADVAIIPFVRSAQTRAIYPLKLNEYLAAGKPVVLTPFADLREFEGLVGVAEDADAFVAAIEKELATDDAARRERRVAVARGNTWAHRTAQMAAILADALEGDRPAERSA